MASRLSSRKTAECGKMDSNIPIIKEVVEMDIEYLEQQSLLQDLKLVALAVPVMLQGRGGV
jgi:lipopolysaccharide/colanic/teichoic acid biosynthesis glycosyltransferase